MSELTPKPQLHIQEHLCDEVEGRRTLLELVDWEIDAKRAESERPGWTKWAIFGSLATVAWVFLSSLGAQGVAWRTVAVHAAGLWMLADLLQWGLRLIGHRSPMNQTLVLRSTVLAHSRTQLILECLRTALLLLIVVTTMPFTWKPSMATAEVFYASESVLLLASTAVSFVRLPLPIPRETGRLSWLRLTPLVPVGLLAVTAVGGPMPVLSSALAGTNLPELRLACLMVAAYYLVLLAARDAAHYPLLNELLSLRRNLALGRIDLDSGRKQLDLTISGLRIADVMEKEVSQVIRYFEELSLSAGQTWKNLSTLDALVRQLAEHGGEAGKDDQVTIDALIEAAERQVGVSKATAAKLVDSVTKLVAGARAWKMMAPDRASEVDAIARDAAERGTAVSKKLEEVLTLTASIKVVAQKYRGQQ